MIKKSPYCMYYGWNGHEIRKGYIVIYRCFSYNECERILLELEAAL